VVSRIPKIILWSLWLALIPAWGKAGPALQYSYFSDHPEVFKKVIRLYRKHLTPFAGEPVLGGIVTHHFLASRLMVEYFETVSRSFQPDRIIIIGPDHFHRGVEGVSLNDLEWKTPFGRLEPDLPAIEAIQRALGLKSYDHDAYATEHSIAVLAPFVKYYFPKARIVPILIRGNANRYMVENLFLALKPLMDSHTHVILSMDFSHYKDSAGVFKADEATEKVMRGMDRKGVWGLDIDSRPGLYLMLKLFQKGRIFIGTHTNSAVLTGDLGMKSCTSYYTVYFNSMTNK